MAGYCSGKSLHYYSVVTRFESLPDHILSRLRFLVIFISLSTQVEGNYGPMLRDGRFLTSRFPFIIHSTIRRYMPVIKTVTAVSQKPLLFGMHPVWPSLFPWAATQLSRLSVSLRKSWRKIPPVFLLLRPSVFPLIIHHCVLFALLYSIKAQNIKLIPTRNGSKIFSLSIL